MQEKLEKKTNLLVKSKGIVSSLAISFFFSSFFLLILTLTIGEYTDTYLSLANMMAVEVKEANNEGISIDSTKQKLTDYPAYGKVFADLSIPSIGVDLPVYHGDTLDILRYGVGHYAGSFFPGEGGSVIFAAHNNYFRKLNQTKIGDKIIVKTIYGTFTYEIYDAKIINETEEDALPINEEPEILMAYTCYPPTAVGHTPLRYLTYSKLVEVDYDEIKTN